MITASIIPFDFSPLQPSCTTCRVRLFEQFDHVVVLEHMANVRPPCAWLLSPAASIVAPLTRPPALEERLDRAHIHVAYGMLQQRDIHPTQRLERCVSLRERPDHLLGSN